MQKEPDRQDNITMLKIGEVMNMKNNSDSVWTVLGSCISVIFHVPQKLSLICHAQLPYKSRNKQSDSASPSFQNNSSGSTDFSYVDSVVEYMINKLVMHGINLNNIHTSLLGGASAAFSNGNDNSIGSKNIAAAKEILTKYKIKINRELTGGFDGITLWYYPRTNILLVNRHGEKGKFELPNNKMFQNSVQQS